MAGAIHHTMSEENLGRLKILVSALAVIYVMTFVSGFLQDTQLNFFNYIFFSLLFIIGIVLMTTTVKSKAPGKTGAFLFLTGVSTTLLLMFYIGYEWSRLEGHKDLAGFVEGLLYWITLFFWIGVVGSLVVMRRLKGVNSSQS